LTRGDHQGGMPPVLGSPRAFLRRSSAAGSGQPRDRGEIRTHLARESRPGQRWSPRVPPARKCPSKGGRLVPCFEAALGGSGFLVSPAQRQPSRQGGRLVSPCLEALARQVVASWSPRVPLPRASPAGWFLRVCLSGSPCSAGWSLRVLLPAVSLTGVVASGFLGRELPSQRWSLGVPCRGASGQQGALRVRPALEPVSLGRGGL
jgi:hypothetical protein